MRQISPDPHVYVSGSAGTRGCPVNGPVQLTPANLDRVEGVVAMFADTDGSDGSDGGTAIAGGLVDGSTAGRARQQGLSLRQSLVDHETTAILRACGDAVLTGATGTNANDLVIIGIR